MNALEKLRNRACLSQADLAKFLSITQGAISQWEKGTAFPSADKLPALAKLLGCSIDDLYNEESE